MHEHFSKISEENIENFIKFRERKEWDIRSRMKFPVYRSTSTDSKKDDRKIRQCIKIHTALVDKDADFDEEVEPKRKQDQEFKEEGWKKFTSPKMKALVTSHTKIQPRVTSEFINHFWLNEGDSDLVHDVSGETIVERNFGEHGEEIYIDGRYLMDFLRDNGYKLFVGYYQGRQIQNPPHLDLDRNEEIGEERGGKYELIWFGREEGEDWKYWDSSYSWVSLIDPEESELSKREEEEEVKQNTKFRDIEGEDFSVSEAGKRDNSIKSVFFEEEILDRYRRDEGTQVTHDTEQGGSISWDRYYSLRYYRNENHEIYLRGADLQKIPASEIQVWADHNIVPKGGLPEEAWKNYFETKFVDSRPPHKQIIEHFQKFRENLNEQFDGTYISEEIEFEPEELNRPAISSSDAFLETMNEFNKKFIESLEESELRSLLQNNLEESRWKELVENEEIGPSVALFELIRHFESEEFAKEILKPFNVITDFRNYNNHAGSESKKSRALRRLEFEEEPNDYREVYDRFVELFTEMLGELELNSRSWKQN